MTALIPHGANLERQWKGITEFFHNKNTGEPRAFKQSDNRLLVNTDEEPFPNSCEATAAEISGSRPKNGVATQEQNYIYEAATKINVWLRLPKTIGKVCFLMVMAHRLRTTGLDPKLRQA